MTHGLRILLSLLFFLAVVYAEKVCDDPLANCNVETTISFANLDTVQFTYQNQGPTVVSGTSYEMVIKWTPESGAVISHSWEAFPIRRNSFNTCDNSRVWINGTIIGATTYMRGSKNNEPYCIFDIHNAIIPRDIIMNPHGEVYFLFSGYMQTNKDMIIAKNFDTPVVAQEDLIFYLYEFESTALVVNETGTLITLSIGNLTYESEDFDGIGDCNTMGTVVSSINVGSCSFNQESANDPAGDYTYFFPKTLYEFCSDSTTADGKFVLYTSVIALPVDIGSCHYFREEDSTQTIVIEIDKKNVDGSGPGSAQNAEVELVRYEIEQCDPLVYIVPQARVTFFVNYTFSGENVELNKAPYLDVPAMSLVTQGKVCSPHVSGSGTECVYEFVTISCMPMYLIGSNRCVFDRLHEFVIYDLDIEETIDPVYDVSLVHSFPELDTSLEYQSFDHEYCDPPANTEIVDVSDQYTGELKVRNRPGPDWGTEPDPGDIKFYDDIIMQMDLVDAGALVKTEIQFVTVDVRIEDPATSETIAEFRWNKADKIVMHEFTWTRYYDDVHFCSYHNASDNTCEAFYEPGTARVNDYITNVIPGQLPDICQVSVDTTIKDYFVVNLSKWFKAVNLPFVNVHSVGTAVLNLCDGSSNRRALNEHHALEYVTYSRDFTSRTMYYREGDEVPSMGHAGVRLCGSFLLFLLLNHR